MISRLQDQKLLLAQRLQNSKQNQFMVCSKELIKILVKSKNKLFKYDHANLENIGIIHVKIFIIYCIL